ncbi:MAG TPA: ribonuclease P protein component [Longimicrobiales bacterium]|nr:ribonuclease P protein component [Longimicrobiales bacterium]
MVQAPGRCGGGGSRLPRARRITRGREIRALFQRGKRSRTAHLDVFDFASPVAHPRLGVVVPKHKHSGVERNRLKRRLREILRREVMPRLDAAGLNLDVLVRARREAYGAGFSELAAELTHWMEKRCSRAP